MAVDVGEPLMEVSLDILFTLASKLHASLGPKQSNKDQLPTRVMWGVAISYCELVDHGETGDISLSILGELATLGDERAWGGSSAAGGHGTWPPQLDNY